MAQEATLELQAAEFQSPRRPLWRRLLALIATHPLGFLGLICIALFFFCAIFADLVMPFDPEEVGAGGIKESPSLSHPMGTDRLGHDVLSRTIFGARIAMIVGLISVTFGITIGSFFGIVSGYSAGRDEELPVVLRWLLWPILALVALVVLVLILPVDLVLRLIFRSSRLTRDVIDMIKSLNRWATLDAVIQRAVDSLLAFPAVVLLLAIIAVIGDEDSTVRQFLNDYTPVPEGEFWNVPTFIDVVVLSLGIGIAISVGTARVVRGAVLSLKENVYIEAARAMGASDNRIMMRHIFPNVAALVVVLATIFLPIAILAEAAISFLGIGLPSGTPSWGSDMAGENRGDAINRNIWWVVFFPGLALSVVVLGFNLVGDTFRDLSDPRLRGSGLGGGGGGSGGGGL